MTPSNLKSVLITGGATRIGASIVRDLARHDFAVAIHANSSIEAADALARDITAQGGRACTVAADLLDTADIEGLVAAATAAIGPIDLLVNNASIFHDDSLDDFSVATMQRHFAIHLTAPSILTRDFARQLPENCKGLVVNMIDQRVWKLTPRFYSYTLSKSALWTATRTQAQALAPKIRVNAIGPGPTIKSARQTEADFAAQKDGLILKAGPALDEFGQTIRFLYETPSITGQMIALDGGQHLGWETPDIAEIRE